MASASEKQVAIAAKFYEARRSLRRLTGGGYTAQILDNMQIVKEHAVNGDYLQSGMRCAEILCEGGYDVSALWVLAATVELIEPDESTPMEP